MAKSGWFERGSYEEQQKPLGAKTMSNYEIREFSWKSADKEHGQSLYRFESGKDFMVYAGIQARTHGSVSIRYDKETDTIYIEE